MGVINKGISCAIMLPVSIVITFFENSDVGRYFLIAYCPPGRTIAKVMLRLVQHPIQSDLLQ
jgi:hypothetical protein